MVDLVDRGVIRILDLEFVTRREDGSVAALSLQELDSGEFDLSVFAGASSGLLDQSDFDDAGTPSAGLVGRHPDLREPVGDDVRAGVARGGAELVAAGYIPLADIAASLDATEAG